MKKKFSLIVFIVFTLVTAINAQLPIVGVCTNPSNAALVKKNHYNFIQPSVGLIIKPAEADAVFDSIKHALQHIQPPVTALNVFLPGNIKAVGPNADHAALLEHTAIVLERASQLGVTVIVLGSGGSRGIPEGFDRKTATNQFVSLCRQIAAQAAPYNIKIALENLNKGECNFVNTVSEALTIVKKVKHPNFGITADIYHMLRENESPKSIIKAGKHILHCDIAEKENRTAPGVAGDSFVGYFKALQKIKFKGGIALECRFANLEEELPKALTVINEQWLEAAAR